jgi:hypothetical protein
MAREREEGGWRGREMMEDGEGMRGRESEREREEGGWRGNEREREGEGEGERERYPCGRSWLLRWWEEEPKLLEARGVVVN